MTNLMAIAKQIDGLALALAIAHASDPNTVLLERAARKLKAEVAAIEPKPVPVDNRPGQVTHCSNCNAPLLKGEWTVPTADATKVWCAKCAAVAEEAKCN